MQTLKIAQLHNITSNQFYVLQVDAQGEIVVSFINSANLSPTLQNLLDHPKLDGLDVDLTGIAHTDVLQLHNGKVSFIPLAQLGLGKIGTTDVTLTSVTEGDIIQYKTGKFVNTPFPTPIKEYHCVFNSDLDTSVDVFFQGKVTLTDVLYSTRIYLATYAVRLDSEPVLWTNLSTLTLVQKWFDDQYLQGKYQYYLRVSVNYSTPNIGQATAIIKYK